MRIQNQFRLTGDSGTFISDAYLKTLNKDGLLNIFNKSGK